MFHIKKGKKKITSTYLTYMVTGMQWLSGIVLDLSHCLVSLSKNINPSLVLVQPRKTHPFITERLLMGCKESKQTNHGHLSLIAPEWGVIIVRN